MCSSALRLVCVSLLFGTSLSCYQCFVDVQDSSRLCSGHILTEHNIRNVGACFRKLDHMFNHNERVIEAGRVGKGYDKRLKELLDAEILPLVEEFENKLNDDTVYEERLQTAADNFIAAASKLPRVSGCFPPCGFQSEGAEYNCVTCQYDKCEFPLDCPVQEIKVMENSRSRMRCDVPFHLPNDMEVIWRFAEEVKTQLMDQFKEVTSGVDRLYSIPSTSLQHQGTYLCEIYSGQRSIVRLYFYISVTPQVVAGHTELQEMFDLSLLPGGRLLPAPGGPPPRRLLLLSPLHMACLTALLLLLFLSLGALHLSMVPEQTSLMDVKNQDPES
ncbi:sperm acrosome membrane-associated protein 6 isoform X2 [Paralichthys olivaceus]|uniref:sperm acrosome membrane-associated protein 6 isoform X2 n=1 Tax=Paralichthys olivaceus TaxID=8255 RepID=UPI0037512999